MFDDANYDYKFDGMIRIHYKNDKEIELSHADLKQKTNCPLHTLNLDDIRVILLWRY